MIRHPNWTNALTRQLAPAIGYKWQAACEAQQALARAALALKLYKHQHGRYPDNLDALTPDPVREVPKDPFTGRPLIYGRTEKGFLLYSVGRDLKDNAGNETPLDEWYPDEGVDIVWKVEG